MYPCHSLTFVNFLFRIILARSKRNRAYYPVIRMSDLKDELYNDFPESQNYPQNEVARNNQTFILNNEEMKNNNNDNNKKKSITIKINTSDIHFNNNDVKIEVLATTEWKSNTCSEPAKISDKSYAIELQESFNNTDNLQKLDHNESLFIDDQKKFDENESKEITDNLTEYTVKCKIYHKEVNSKETADLSSDKDNNKIHKVKEAFIYPSVQEIENNEGNLNKTDSTRNNIIVRNSSLLNNGEIFNNNSLNCIAQVTKNQNSREKIVYPGIRGKRHYEGDSNTTDPTLNIFVENSSLLHNNDNGEVIENNHSLNYINIDTKKQKHTEETPYNTKSSVVISVAESSLSNRNNSLIHKKEKDKTKDSLIIKDIVMNQFGELLDQSMKKSLERKEKRNYQPFYDDNQVKLKSKFEGFVSVDVKNVDCHHELSKFYSKTPDPDSGLDATFKDSDQSLQYSSTLFLREALGDEYMNITFDSQQENCEDHCSTPISVPPIQYERSIGSSEISILISAIDGVDSLYSTVDKSKKKRRSSKKTSPVAKKKLIYSNKTKISSSDSADTYTPIYESIDKLRINHTTEQVINAISIQCAIADQALKAVRFCRQSPVFFGSIPHLEAEKLLLFATHKKEILENTLNNEYEEMEPQQCYGNVNVENLMFSINTSEINNEYYICLAHSGVTLLSSDILFPEKNGDLLFKKSFQFKNLSSDFEIHIKIYSLILGSNLYKKKLHINPNKMWFTRKNRKVSKDPSFELLGISTIKVSDLFESNTFTLEKLEPNGKISRSFTADIHCSIIINNNITGFLTIGTSNILWNRRWCTLEGHFLKYWNYPSDENGKEPIGILNLSNCVTHQLTSVNKDICSRPRTMIIKIKSKQGTAKQYFLQADNLLEFEEWKRQLNSVLISLKNWRSLKD